MIVEVHAEQIYPPRITAWMARNGWITSCTIMGTWQHDHITDPLRTIHELARDHTYGGDALDDDEWSQLVADALLDGLAEAYDVLSGEVHAWITRSLDPSGNYQPVCPVWNGPVS